MRDPLLLGVLLFLLSALASTIFSQSPRTSYQGEAGSLGGLVTVTGLVILFFATRLLVRNERDARQLLAAALIATVGASLFALTQVVGADPYPWKSIARLNGYFRPFASLGHPNFLAAYLAMGLALTCYFTIQPWKREDRAFRLLGMFTMLAATLLIFLTYTRSVWLAVGAMMFAAWLPGLSRRGRGGRLMLLLGLAVLLLGTCFLLLPGPMQQHALERALRSNSLKSRVHLWQAALTLFGREPWLGQGLNTFRLTFASVRTPEFSESEWNTTPFHAHNSVLDLLAEQGLLGAAAGLLMIVGLVRAGYRAWRRHGVDKQLVLALLAAMLGFMIQNLFSYTVAATGTLFVTMAAMLARLGEPLPDGCNARGFCCGLKVGVVLVTLALLYNLGDVLTVAPTTACMANVGVVIGILATLYIVLRQTSGDVEVQTPRRKHDHRRCPSWLVPSVVGIWVLIGMIALHEVIRPARAELAVQRGESIDGPDVSSVLGPYRQAVALAPEREHYWFMMARRCLVLSDQVRQQAERIELLEAGREACVQAVALAPQRSTHHGLLARLLTNLARLKRADAAAALCEYDRALEIDPHHAILLTDAANAALTLCDLDRARDYVERGLARYPRYAVLQAHRGYVAMAENHFGEACLFLREALQRGDWRHDPSGRAFAERMLKVARQQAALQQSTLVTEKP
ncbi:MAG: O-antigen ligase family protein [Gemmataceae bacterium]